MNDLFPSAAHDAGGKVRLKVPRDVLSSARFSPCGRYRYVLDRRWGGAEPDAPFVLWVMLNPSTATEHVDDPTVAKCRRYSTALGYRRLIVTNLFAYRATSPDGLLGVADPIGPDNDDAIRTAAHDPACALTVYARGEPNGKLGKMTRARALAVATLTGALGQALAVTKSGQPRHPLYLPGDARLSFWSPPAG